MVAPGINPEVRSKLIKILSQAPSGACFLRCELASFSEAVLRCRVAMPEQSVRFMVTAQNTRDDRGEAIPAGQPISAWSRGWVLGEVAGVGNGPENWTIVRILQADKDLVEIESDSHEVVRPA